MILRFASLEDAPVLGRLNRELVEDEGHRNRMSVEELEARMRAWLGGEYRALVGEEDGGIVGYALFRETADEVYLRQLFIARHRRRTGLGRRRPRPGATPIRAVPRRSRAAS